MDITAYVVEAGVGDNTATAAGDGVGDIVDDDNVGDNNAIATTYYGNAEPEGPTVVVGGNEVVVGGWASYEAIRREAHWRANPRNPEAEPRSWYGGRTYISGQDAVESLITSRCRRGRACSKAADLRDGSDTGANRADPLDRAAERLALAIEGFDKAVAREGATTVWGRLGVPPDAPVAVSTISPEDIRYASSDTDLAILHRAAEDAGIFASSYAREAELPRLRPPRPPASLPPLPSREVPLRGKRAADVNRAIADLEKAAVPRAAAVETYRGEVAAVFDAAAAVLERAVA